MAFTRGCSAGWLASVCAPTNAHWLHTGCVVTGTQPSCTSWLPVTLACPLKSSSRTRRAPCSYLLHLWRPRLSPHMLQTALHLWSRGLMPPCHQDSTPAASMVSWSNTLLFIVSLLSPSNHFHFLERLSDLVLFCVKKKYIFWLTEGFVGSRSFVGWLRQGNVNWNQSSN